MTFWISPGVWHPNYLTVREGVANFKRAVEQVRYTFFPNIFSVFNDKNNIILQKGLLCSNMLFLV